MTKSLGASSSSLSGVDGSDGRRDNVAEASSE